jgi:hypothetical protein
MVKPEDFLSAPIPGMSLTVEPGSVPWEQPPQYTTIQQVADFYIDKLTSDDDAIDKSLDAIEMGVPLQTLANGAISYNMMKGIHTIDVGFLVMPIIVELLITLAELNNIKYYITAEDELKGKVLDRSIVEKVVNSTEEKDSEVKTEEAIKSLASSSKGLMSKGNM